MSGPDLSGAGPANGAAPVEAVREAVGGDRVRLLELSQELVRGITSQRGGSLFVGGDRLAVEEGTEPGRLDGLFGAGSSRVVVGTLDQAVIGFAVCHVVDEGDQGRRGVLDACYVEPEARGVGVGRLLVEASVSWLEERGCDGVDGVALPGDRGAKNFYESAGFKARMITMYRRMD
jgi:ribosomal protein S18 acetylase RimI-like enzyme